MENPEVLPPPPPDSPGKLTSIRGALNRNRKLISVGVLGTLILIFGVWAKNDYRLDIFRFFAAEGGPEVVINTGLGPYSHGERLSVSWSKTDAVRCDSLNDWIDTGGAVEGTANSPPIDACAGQSSGQVNIQCTFEDGSVANTTVSFSIDQSTCPIGSPTPTPTSTTSPTTPPTAKGCESQYMQKLDTPGIQIGGGNASSRVRNDSDSTCKIILASYQIWSDRGGSSPHYISQQTRYSYDVKIVGSGQTATFSTNLPNCYSQIDLLVGNQGDSDDSLVPQVGPDFQSGNFFGVQFADGPYCDKISTTPTPTPTTTTTPTPTSSPTPTPTPTPTPLSPALSINKLVKNVSQGTGDMDLVTANPDETVEFTIQVSSVGNATAQGVHITDTLPFGLAYSAGTTILNGIGVADGITSSGIFIGDMAIGQTANIRFRNRVAGEASFSVGTTSLVNTAVATSTNAPTVNDTAVVNVNRITNLQLSLQKLGRNLTRGELNEQLHVNGVPNDVIEFILKVKSLSDDQVTNVILKDTLPAGISYMPNTTTLNGANISDGIVSSQGINIGSLNPDQEAIVRFSVMASPATAWPQGNSTVINTVQVSADGIAAIISQLPITIANGSIAGAGQVPTGTRESLLLAIIVSVIITLMYMTYTRTAAFRRREAESIIKHRDSDHDSFDFKG